MFIRSAVKTSRSSLVFRSRMFLSFVGVAMLTFYAAPEAAATTYHATSGYCQNTNPGSDVSWNFVLNPTVSNPSTLTGTSNYSVEFASGDCFWSAFAAAGTPASSSAKIVIEYKTIYNSDDNGTNPAGAAKIYGGTSSSPGKFGSFFYHPPSNPQTNLTTTGTENFPIPEGTDLSTVVVEDLVNSGNQFTSSMELNLEAVYISN